MARLSLYLSVCLALSCLPTGFAGPACAKRHFQAADCVEVCKSRWGWSGTIMGTDPWGAVVKNVDPAKALEDVIKEACGTSVAPSTPTPASSSVSPHSTRTVLPTEAVTSTISVPSSSNAVTSLSLSPSPSVISTTASSSSVVTSAPISTSVVAASAATPSASSSSFGPQAFVGSIPSRSSTTSSVIRPSPTSIRRPDSTPTPTPQVQPVDTDSNTDSASSGGSTSNSDIQAYLSAHNTIRAQHGAAALTWNNDLAGKAQQWANGCQFKHSGGSLGAFGENLAAGTGSNYGIVTAVKSWTDEVSQYNPNNPQPSHFTQVVWKGTTQVGCAVQTCNGILDAKFGPAKYFVCEYSPQGNIIGRFAQNVQV